MTVKVWAGAVDEAAPRPPAPASWYVVVGGNDCFWRVDAPAKAIGGKTFQLPEVPEVDEDGELVRPGAFYALTQPNDDSDFRWQLLVDRNDPDYAELHLPDHEGAAVWTRPDLARATMAKAMREGGIRTLAEVDDDYTTPPSQNVFMRAMRFSAQDRLDHLKAIFSQSGIVFSTAHLRDTYWRTARRDLGLSKRQMPDLFVCRNHIAREDWPEPITRKGPLRVGWMGSPSHVYDIDLAAPAFLRAQELGCECWLIGYDPREPGFKGEMAEIGSTRQLHIWERVGYTHRKWIKPDLYHRTALPFDIGLAPLVTTRHTNGKSDVKAVEYAISGAAPVLWQGVVYGGGDWKHGENCLLVSSPREMADAVALLVRDRGLREAIVANAREYVARERNEDVMRKEWGDAIDG